MFNVITFFTCQGPRSSGASSVLGSRQEERVSLSVPCFDDDNDEDKISENEVQYNLMTTVGSAALNSIDILCSNSVLFSQPSPRGPDRLLKNLHLDLDDLGGGLQYEVDRFICSRQY